MKECSEKLHITAIVLAGGAGKRFGGDVPKQYQQISGKPVLSYALESFQNSVADEIIIAAGKDYLEMCRDIALRAGVTKLRAVIEGGSERYYSVMKGLEFLRSAGKVQIHPDAMPAGQENPACTSSDMILIHDGARPFISTQLINDVIKNVREHGAAIAAIPCTDTIKITDENGMIISTTDRSRTWAAQTPQGFWLEEIYRAYDLVLSEKDNMDLIPLNKITDDAMIYQLAFPGRKVKAVLSTADNIKITRARDLNIAAALAAICE